MNENDTKKGSQGQSPGEDAIEESLVATANDTQTLNPQNDQKALEQSASSDDGYVNAISDRKDLVSDDLGSNPILQKIGRLLTNSSGKDWRQGGLDVNSDVRVARPMQVHEFVYVRDLPNHSLVVRVATPVSCQYAAGGYRLTPLTSGNYSIELRDRVFDPDKLVDPKFSSNFKGKNVEVLATGEVARKLFEDVRELVRGSTVNLQREFDLKAVQLFEGLLEMVESGKVTGWSRHVAMVEERDNTTYSATHDGLELSIVRSVQGWDAKYDLIIKQNKLLATRSGSTAKLIFDSLEKQEQNKQLGELEKKLKALGLSED
jgi:hypothetical protein